MSETWPDILIPTDVSFALKPMNAAGPPTASGRRQIAATDAGYWSASLSGFYLHTADQIREWRGLITSLSGMAKDVVIGPFDCRHPPWPIIAGKSVRRITGLTHSDGTKLSDLTTYTQSALTIALDADAALRATTLSATVEDAGPLRRGMYFSIDDRLYMITSAPVQTGSSWSFAFLPPLRAPALAGTILNFGSPRATMRLSDPDAGTLSISMGRFAQPMVDLQESFNGL